MSREVSEEVIALCCEKLEHAVDVCLEARPRGFLLVALTEQGSYTAAMIPPSLADGNMLAGLGASVTHRVYHALEEVDSSVTMEKKELPS